MSPPPVRSLGSLLTKTKWLLDAEFNRRLRAADVPLTPEQWAVLVAIYVHPGDPQSVVAGRAFKDRTNLARLLDLLERRGLVERREHQSDRRAYRIHLSTAGRRLTEKVFPLAAAVNARLLAPLTAHEAERLVALLERVKDGATGDETGSRPDRVRLPTPSRPEAPR